MLKRIAAPIRTINCDARFSHRRFLLQIQRYIRYLAGQTLVKFMIDVLLYRGIATNVVLIDQVSPSPESLAA